MTTISHYEILEEVGRGGMGVVHKARDTRLGRTVALKLLSQHLSNDGEAKSRFLREGRAASILDHANICTIYDVGETDDGSLYMAMAYVEGSPLSDLIAERPLKLAKALDIAIAVGEGLVHSHAAGVVHRDMKPANVMITESGGVKILDFGLARLQDSTLLTTSGTMLGTAAYMSPEQAQGQRADERTDTWALGVILYEMIAGVRPFKGEYQQALSYAIVHDEPEPLTSLRSGLPLEIDRIISKALSKDPDARYQHVDELVVDLRSLRASVVSGSSSLTAPSISKSTPKSKTHSSLVWGAAAIAGAVIGAALVSLTMKGHEASAPQIRMTVETMPMPVPAHPLAPILAISPDGSMLAYERQVQGSSALVLRRLDSFTETVVSGSAGGRSPFFSPDGVWLGFLTDTEVKKYSIESGDMFTISRVRGLTHGASWGSDGTIYVGMVHSLTKVSSSGGELEVFCEVDPENLDEHFIVWPEELEPGKSVLATTISGSGSNSMVWSVDVESGERTFLLDGGNSVYLKAGYIVVGRQNSLWAARLSPDLEVRSSPVRVYEDVLGGFAGEPSLSMFAVSQSGVLASVANQSESGLLQILSVEDDGSVKRLSSEAGFYLGLRYSPKGDELATTVSIDGIRHVVVLDTEREMWSTVTTGGGGWWPGWGQDGRRIYMTRQWSDTSWGLASQRLGSHNVEKLTSDRWAYQFGSWIPNTETMVLQRENPASTTTLDLVKMGPGNEIEPFIATPFVELHPSVSPNGRWIAYAAAPPESEQSLVTSFEVFVRPIDSPEPQIQVSTAGGWAPRWTPDGKRLYYEARDGIMRIDWPDTDSLRPGRPEIFYNGPFARSLHFGLNYDVGPDGHPVILRPEAEIRNINVVTGWLAEIEQALGD